MQTVFFFACQSREYCGLCFKEEIHGLQQNSILLGKNFSASTNKYHMSVTYQRLMTPFASVSIGEQMFQREKTPYILEATFFKSKFPKYTHALSTRVHDLYD